jgi:tetratricopeptide (TPR) repeat protein
LHFEVGEALEILYADRLDDLAAILSEHFDKAGEALRALKYYRIAAGRAAAAYANQEAENHYLRAIELAADDGLKADLYAELGETQYSQSHYAQADQTLQKAIQLYRQLNNIDQAARLQARCARGAWFAGEIPRSLRLCLEGLQAAAGAPESPGLACLIHEAARSSYFNGKKEDASRLSPGIGNVRAPGMPRCPGDSWRRWQSWRTLHQKIGCLTKSRRLAEPAGLLQLLRALINLGNAVQSDLNDQKTARDHFLHAAELVVSAGVVSWSYPGLRRRHLAGFG